MKWIKNHLILTWTIASVLFAIIVHCLFSIQAPFPWLIAQWSAGELLTYVSTVALGLLAVWQNKKFKKENDIAQERLERLTEHANELTTVNRIIEIENERLNQLKESLDSFAKACDPQEICRIYVLAIENPSSIVTAMSELENDIDNYFYKACRELRIDLSLKKDDSAPIKQSIASYYQQAITVVNALQTTPIDKVKINIDTLIELRKHFLPSKESYIIQQENKINQLIYGNMTLTEIKNLYNRNE